MERSLRRLGDRGRYVARELMVMMFRVWYRICQIAVIGFVLVAFGLFLPSEWRVSQIGVCITVPVCLVGAVLGVAWTFIGLRSPCPLCGAVGDWVAPAKHYLAIDCPNCGLVGGRILCDLKLRFLSEFYDDDTSTIPETEDRG